jgi:hypothetical protein
MVLQSFKSLNATDDTSVLIRDDTAFAAFGLIVLDKVESYAPYFMDLGLAKKSPYSAVTSPNIHYRAHIVGCCPNNERSKNARFVGEPSLANSLNRQVLANLFIHIFLPQLSERQFKQ